MKQACAFIDAPRASAVVEGGRAAKGGGWGNVPQCRLIPKKFTGAADRSILGLCAASLNAVPYAKFGHDIPKLFQKPLICPDRCGRVGLPEAVCFVEEQSSFKQALIAGRFVRIEVVTGTKVVLHHGLRDKDLVAAPGVAIGHLMRPEGNLLDDPLASKPAPVSRIEDFLTPLSFKGPDCGSHLD